MSPGIRTFHSVLDPENRARTLVIGCSAGLATILFAICLSLAAGVAADEKGTRAQQSSDGTRLTSEVSGTIATRDAQKLRLVIDLGNVVIKTGNTGKIDYKVHLEVNSAEKGAQRLLRNFALVAHETPDGAYFRGQTFGHQSSGRLWVTVELNIPKSYNVDVLTGGGNIESEDLNGRESLVTAGGTITAGNIGGFAHLETAGGHVTVKNVAGDLTAISGGGHITTGSISGSANLHTTGGHIRAESIQGLAHVSTGGGNISVDHSGSELVAETIGGQIEVGETSGQVRAKNGGGGIRVVRVSGPTNLETSGGSIYLTQVDSAVKASTSTGAITAWFVAPVKPPSQCEFQSGAGDIVVYIPRQLPITIDAQVQSGDEHQLSFDPAFAAVFHRDDSPGGGVIRAEGSLNGGGEVIHLRTAGGNIHVIMSDTARQLQLYKQQMEQLEQKLALQLRQLQESRQAQNAP
jgi:Putative adhesin